MLHATHPLDKHAQAMHDEAMHDKAQELVHEMRRAEQEEEKRRMNDAQFYILVIGIPFVIIYGVLIYTYGG